jgi:hypothetical protein
MVLPDRGGYRKKAARLMLSFAAVMTSSTWAFAEANAHRLSGAQIRAKLVGKQLTDEVHYRFVFEPDGTLRSYAMSVKKTGRWSVEHDEICLYLGETDDGCYRVSLSGTQIEMTPSGLGGMIDGILQPADHDTPGGR